MFNRAKSRYLRYLEDIKSSRRKNMSRNQKLFARCIAFDESFRLLFPQNYPKIKVGKFRSYGPEEVRFHPWVLSYLVSDISKKLTFCLGLSVKKQSFSREQLFFASEKRRVEAELIQKPKIFSIPISKNMKCPTRPLISVITPSFNHARFLEDTIHSIAAQTFKNFEHIVIDGGSTDKTVAILRRYSHIRWISEKDSGYNEAFGKGLELSRGKFIINCSVSDGFADRNWFKRCVEVLNSRPDVSLVWGFPQNLSEEGIPGKVSYSYFHLVPAPSKYSFFYFWLRTGHGFPEGNICVRKDALEKCLSGLDKRPNECDIWKEFNYNFNALGYLAYHLPVVANFGRAHQGQSGQKDREIGVGPRLERNYMKRINLYRWDLLLGRKLHHFRGNAGEVLPVTFFPTRYKREWLQDLERRVLIQENRLSVPEWVIKLTQTASNWLLDRI